MADSPKRSPRRPKKASSAGPPSMTDLARELGVSISTVSRALSDSQGVGPEMKQRVLKLVKRYNYRPNQLASALRNGQSKLLGIVVPHLEGRFFASVVHGIEAAASKAGYSAIICQSNGDADQELRHLDTLRSAQVAGVLLSLAQGTHFQQHLLRNDALPLVFFDRVPEGVEVNAVVLDDREAGYLATRHLLSQGCRRIVHLAGPQQLNTYRNRRQGYLDALREAQLAPDELLTLEMELRPGQAAEAMRQLLGQPSPPDGLFAANDYAALEAIQEASRQGVRVPEDLAVVGFSNEAFTALTMPTLTTIDQQAEEMGRAAVRLLLEVIREGKARPVPRKVVLLPKLLVRDSSGRRTSEALPALEQPGSGLLASAA